MKVQYCLMANENTPCSYHTVAGSCQRTKAMLRIRWSQTINIIHIYANVLGLLLAICWDKCNFEWHKITDYLVSLNLPRRTPRNIRNFRLSPRCKWDLRSSEMLHGADLHLVNDVSSSWTAWLLQMGPTGCPETSVTNYRSTLRNMPEERISASNLISVCSSHRRDSPAVQLKKQMLSAAYRLHVTSLTELAACVT